MGSVDPLYRIDGMFFTRAAKLIMILGGLYPIGNKRLETLINVLTLMGMFGCAVASIIQFCYLATKFSIEDINHLCNAAYLGLWTFIQFYVLLNVQLKKKRVMKFCRFIQNVFCKREYRSNEMVELDNCNKMCYSIALGYAIFTATCYSIFLGLPIMERRNTNFSEKAFPSPMFYDPPFMYETPIYETVYSAMVVTTVAVWLMDNTMNYFSLFLLFFIATQFTLLKGKIRLILITKNGNEKLSKNIKDCFDDYDKLIHYVDEDNALYSSVYLVCAVINVASTCACLYLFAQISNDVYFTINNTARLASMVLSSFGTCFAAQQLINQSENLDFAIYQVLTELLCSRQCDKDKIQILSIMHCRAQRPSCITVRFIGQISVQTFKAMVKSSYSYFSILRQMNET